MIRDQGVSDALRISLQSAISRQPYVKYHIIFMFLLDECFHCSGVMKTRTKTHMRLGTTQGCPFPARIFFYFQNSQR